MTLLCGAYLLPTSPGRFKPLPSTHTAQAHRVFCILFMLCHFQGNGKIVSTWGDGGQVCESDVARLTALSCPFPFHLPKSVLQKETGGIWPSFRSSSQFLEIFHPEMAVLMVEWEPKVSPPPLGLVLLHRKDLGLETEDQHKINPSSMAQ